MEEKSLISVIIPVFNTEKFLAKCLDSIINQTYKNLEIIAVNDASTDGSAEILKFYAQKDSRIKIVNNPENQGLFRTRVNGLSVATGDYIGIVDSDDYISKDYFRNLIETAEEKQADIVMGKIIHEKSGGYQYVHNSYHNMEPVARYGDDVLNKYLEQEGCCFIWHTVWNKLYTKKIWDKALPFFKTIEEHIIMCEDVLFSTIIHTFAKSFVSTDYAFYFYMQHAGASTTNDNNFNKFNRNITSLVKVFNIVEEYLKANNISKENQEHFQNWKRLYSRFWYDNVNYSQLAKSKKTLLFNILKDGLNLSTVEPSSKSDNYFYQLTTQWDGRYEKLINHIIDENINVLSIDIFDTIIVRPFLKPTDLFLTLDSRFDELCKDSVLTNFSDIRIFAEKECRQKLYKTEEVTLDEIYDYIVNKFHISKLIADQMKQAEIDAELEYCRPRKSVVNLINIAKHLNKKIVCTSDFYMDKNFIKKLLDKNKIPYDEIFVSSEYGLTKRTGSLFTKVIDELGVNPENILHIGDNWNSDYVKPENYKIQSVFYPSCKNAFMYEISDMKASDVTAVYKRPSGMWINYEKSLQFFETRCALALCAIKLYDNPYYSYHEGTYFNGDSNFIGYYALGMHLWAISKWLYKENLNKKGKIHFIARDGYLPKLAYDCLNKDGKARVSNYVYVSRKSLMPLIITNANSFYSLENITVLSRQSSKQLLKLFKPVLNKEKYNELFAKASDDKFETDENAIKYIDNVLVPSYDEKEAKKYNENIFEYFNQIFKKGDTSFDIGYSGRTQLLLTKLLGFNIDAFFIHQNDDMFTRKHNELGINIKTLYNYTPSITGSIREFSISETCPSCIGYDFEKQQPIFEEFNVNYSWKYAIESMQNMALNFVKDMNSTFGIRDDFTARAMDLSMPYEYLLHHTPWEDTNYFSACEFEDDLYEGKSKANLSNIWQRDMAYHHVLTWNSSNYWVPQYNGEPVGEVGVYGRLYNKINKLFPVGTKRRKFFKFIGKLFVGKKK